MEKNKKIEDDIEKFSDILSNIEKITGFSRKILTSWLQTSHTPMDEIANPSRIPRTSLEDKIKNLSRLVLRLQSIYGTNQDMIKQSLITKPQDSQSALTLVLEGNYQKAATAAQYAIHPRRHLKTVRGKSYMNSRMIAVEDI